MAGFFEELKRRNVLKVAVVYLVTGWLIVQVMDAAFPMLLLPDWIPRAVLFLLMLGFPVALILAWAFELTPEGIKRDKEVSRSKPTVGETGRKIDFVIIGLLVIAVGYFAVDKFLLRDDATDESIADSADVVSIAVLPFVNMSDDRENEYFADGLAEELLNLLAKRTDLRVAARTSSFQFKDYTGDVQDIGQQLRVDHIVEGSVRRAGDRVRVTAQLVDVNDGFHRWSETYDRKLEDIFAVQDEISEAIATALQASLSGSGAATRTTENLEAYELYIQGRFHWRQRTPESIERAIELFKATVELDAGFARAHEGLAGAYRVMPYYTFERAEEYLDLAADTARQALELDEQLAEAWATLGFVEEFRHNWIEAGRLKRHALTVDPDNAMVNHWFAEHLGWAGLVEQALRFGQVAYELDPLAPVIVRNLSRYYRLNGDYDNALKYGQITDDLGVSSGKLLIAQAYESMGDMDKAIEFFREYERPDWFINCLQHVQTPDVYLRPADLPDRSDAVVCYQQLGDHEAAFRLTAKLSLTSATIGGNYFNLWSAGSHIVEHAEFPALAEELGLLAYWQANGFPSNCRPEGESVHCTAR